jgi:hypothetical protein
MVLLTKIHIDNAKLELYVFKAELSNSIDTGESVKKVELPVIILDGVKKTGFVNREIPFGINKAFIMVGK